MSDNSLEKRIAVLEAMMGGKTLEEHFREHAELIDRRFAEVHARFAEIHARFTAQDKRFEAIEAQFSSMYQQFSAIHSHFATMDERFNRVGHELGVIHRDIRSTLTKLSDIGTKLSVS
jgi:DNA anti-recombination protein RmuC